ncbi:M15 family metallopeptidase [Methylocystis sp. FS]|uniref:M15 family metallopeptidase n=1 Tax=Methylocystis silviterrae TaxID=2743612 RepID=UPI001582D6BA|nr:M15 family metallopeptidase [Methylocystis silviterrae]NUJ79341.1 M15 family metallopeptidase [Methylocystis silviterrae]
MPWPKQSECNAFYGDPRGRNGLASASWEAKNLTYVTPPFPIFFLGKSMRLRVHKKCADAFMAWVEAVWSDAGKDRKIIKDWGMDNTAGGYNFRAMRGGRTLSMHTWGCAVDFDAPRNGQYDRTPHFETLREQVVKPFLALGGVWGGDWDGDGDSLDERACDGMHFQFARLG